jgi:uncharacterized protein (TIGR02246 family)
MSTSPAELIRHFMEAVNRGDLDAALSYYEKDAILISQPGKIAKGTNQIRAALGEFIALKPKLASSSSKTIDVGNLVLYCSKWNMACTTPDGKPMELRGASSDVLRQQPDGNWLIAIDNPWGADIIE